MSFLEQQMIDATLAMAALLVPLLTAASVIGFAFALFQALTQVQDQTLPQVIKIITVGLMVFAFGGVLTQPLLAFAGRAFLMGSR